jgi:hypothetical protein
VSQQGSTNWLMADTQGNLITELRSTGRSTGLLLSQTIITDGNWHRIGFVWDGTKRILYVDDIVVAEDTQVNLQGSSGGLYIGTGKMMQPGTYFSGLIDDVRIKPEINKQPNTVKGPTDLGTVGPFMFTWHVIGMLEESGESIVIRRTICYNKICRYKAYRLWAAVLYGL